MAPSLTAEQRALADRPVLAALTTLHPDGSPHTTPVWIDRDGDDVAWVHTGENVYSPAARALDKTSAKEIQMRRLAFVQIAVLVTVLAAACSEAPRRTFRVSLDGQSPPEPPKPTGPAAPPEPPAPDTAAASSPAWLRSASLAV